MGGAERGRMVQVVECNGCGKRLRAGEELAGLKVRCPRCESTVRVPRIRNQALDDLDLNEPLDPPSALPPRDDEKASGKRRRKKKSRRRSGEAAGWPAFSRWWTLAAGGSLIMTAFFYPRVGILFYLPFVALSAAAFVIILLVVMLPIVIDHPFLFLQMALFGRGVGRFTSEQRERDAARFRRIWPALSHVALALGCSALAALAVMNSPWIPPALAAQLKRKPQHHGAVEQALAAVQAAKSSAATDLPEADAPPPEALQRPITAHDWSPRPGWPGNAPQLDASASDASDAKPFPAKSFPSVQPAIPSGPSQQASPQQPFPPQGRMTPGDFHARVQARRRALQLQQQQFLDSVRRRHPAPFNPPANPSAPAPGTQQPAPAAPRGGL
jgi:hypothetical protein